jgi:hypothetical protein
MHTRMVDGLNAFQGGAKRLPHASRIRPQPYLRVPERDIRHLSGIRQRLGRGLEILNAVPRRSHLLSQAGSHANRIGHEVVDFAERGGGVFGGA